MPFGEDLNVGVGNRTGDTGLKYSMPGDNVRQKFTGYQKDNETQLDFAEARMYENRFGRFTAVDPLMASGRTEFPQTWNRFVYCLNNPIVCTDPTGLDGGIWAMQYNNGGVTLRHFKTEGEFNEANSMESTEFCKQNECNLWTRYTREWFLWDDQTVSHLGSNGVEFIFSVATIGEPYWSDLVSSSYSDKGFTDPQVLMLQTLRDARAGANAQDEFLGLKENPRQLQMGKGKNPLAVAKDVGLAIRKFTVGDYNQLRKAAGGTGLDAHKVGQKALMERFIPNYSVDDAPAILVPKEGHRFNIPGIGRLSTSTVGFSNARQVLARDIWELRRVYQGVSNSDLRQLIHLNRLKYPSAFYKPPK